MDEDDAGLLGIDRAGKTHRRSVDRKLAPGRRMVAGQDLHQRGFAGAVLADQAMHFAWPHRHIDVAQHLDDAKCLGNAPRLQDGGRILWCRSRHVATAIAKPRPMGSAATPRTRART
ncbi:hypothetical protein D9M72_579570 [compost metagenome]